MSKKSLGAVSTTFGAISYGVPGVVLSLAAGDGARISNIIATQYLLSFSLFYFLSEMTNDAGGLSSKSKILLLSSGIPTLCVTFCFYKALTYLGVPTATMLMMQSAWIAPLLSAIVQHKSIRKSEFLFIGWILAGVAVATGMLSNNFVLNLAGMLWGLASALSYSLVIISLSNLSPNAKISDKAKWIMLGAFISSLFLFQNKVDISLFNSDVKWALLSGLFSSVLPIILFGFGMPRTSPALSGMLVTLELPAAYVFSYLLLAEHITRYQLAGCLIIVAALITSSVYNKVKMH